MDFSSFDFIAGLNGKITDEANRLGVVLNCERGNRTIDLLLRAGEKPGARLARLPALDAPKRRWRKSKQILGERDSLDFGSSHLCSNVIL